MVPADADAAARWRERVSALGALGVAERAAQLSAIATASRRRVLGMITEAGQGHIGGDFSVLDILTVLFNGGLRVDPERPDDPDRDVFVLSKGHAAAALYVTLADCGFFSRQLLHDFMKPLSPVNGHPARSKLPGVETSTGPLGHGLPVAVGAALGIRAQGRGSRVVVVTGDGELQEGSNWEAMMAASQFALDNLTIVVDRNRLQQGARTEETNALDPLDRKLAAFGMEVREVDGHDFAALESALARPEGGRPVAVIANTVKGKGVSFVEDRAEWHHKVPSAEQAEAALKELA